MSKVVKSHFRGFPTVCGRNSSPCLQLLYDNKSLIFGYFTEFWEICFNERVEREFLKMLLFRGLVAVIDLILKII